MTSIVMRAVDECELSKLGETETLTSAPLHITRDAAPCILSASIFVTNLFAIIANPKMAP
jgi:hypothetical protein